MNYIDTHCHIDGILKKKEFSDYPKLKADHFPQNFEGAITISCDPNSIEAVLGLMEFEEVYAAFGIHPHDAKEYSDSLEEKLKECMANSKTLAWGEIGLDYHYNFSDPNTQKKVFIRQIEKAIELDKPIVIHTREAEEDSLQIMKEHIPNNWKVHVHCFTSSLNMAENLLSHFENLYLGFTGVITFKNSEELKKVAAMTPNERFLLETDAPYLAPVPYRGKPCHSGYIPFIAEELAKIKATSLDEIYALARENTRQMYGI